MCTHARFTVALGALALASVGFGCSPFSGYHALVDHDAGHTLADAGGNVTLDASAPSSTGDAAVGAKADAGVKAANPDVPKNAVHIRDCAGLQAMQKIAAAHYVLDKNIDCLNFDSGGGAGFLPIGSSASPFSGVFDGQGHTITNLWVSQQFDSALFGVTQGAHIHDVAVVGATMTGGNRIAVLIGRATADTLVSSVAASGRVAASGSAGGLVGELSGSTIENCRATVTVESQAKQGGLLIGTSVLTSALVNSYANGVAVGAQPVLVSSNVADTPLSVRASFFDCDAGQACDPKNLQSLSAQELSIPARLVYAGWDYATPAWGVPAAGVGAPCLAWEAGCVRYASSADLPLAGAGTSGFPYQISTCSQLQAMAIERSAHYVLTNDIECGGFDMGDGQGFWPVGGTAQPFRGVLTSLGHHIKHLHIMRPRQDNVGLFGVVESATLHDITLDGVQILGGTNVGAVAGTWRRTTLDSCAASGALAAKSAAADGYVGYYDGTPPTATCTGTVITATFK